MSPSYDIGKFEIFLLLRLACTVYAGRPQGDLGRVVETFRDP